jgi:hypothetical protein
MVVGAESDITVRRNQAPLREGPGSFYEILDRVPGGTTLPLLEASGLWLKVHYVENKGYVSEKVTKKPKKSRDVFSKMAFLPADTKLSRHGMSAGTKGFAMRFGRKIQGDTAAMEKIAAYRLDPLKYETFRNKTYQGRSLSRLRDKFSLPSQEIRHQFTPSEQGLGLGIASKVVTLKLFDHHQITDYVNMVGNLVVEASHGYDLPFRFAVLDSPLVNAYACPSGYVFITRGLLAVIRNEAELAAVVGHEITHVLNQHGLKEIQERRVQITAERAFDELEEAVGEMPDHMKATEEELENFALSAYEIIYAGRLDQYESEADQFGMLLAARSGYDPAALADLLQRMILSKTESTNEHYRPQANKKRLAEIRKELQSGRWKGEFERFEERWQANIAGIAAQ